MKFQFVGGTWVHAPRGIKGGRTKYLGRQIPPPPPTKKNIYTRIIRQQTRCTFGLFYRVFAISPEVTNLSVGRFILLYPLFRRHRDLMIMGNCDLGCWIIPDLLTFHQRNSLGPPVELKSGQYNPQL